jgi:hypothetical protein
MSKYSRNKTPPKPTHCSCCKQQGDVAAFGGGLCEPCEQHTFAKRSGAGLAIVKPKTCPGPGVKMSAEEVVAMNGIGN